jgi:hypothetical protein
LNAATPHLAPANAALSTAEGEHGFAETTQNTDLQNAIDDLDNYDLATDIGGINTLIDGLQIAKDNFAYADGLVTTCLDDA